MTHRCTIAILAALGIISSLRAQDVTLPWHTSIQGNFSTNGSWNFLNNGGTEIGALYADTAGAITNGTQTFSGYAPLYVSEPGAIAGGFQYFNDNSSAIIAAENGLMHGASLTFDNSATLVAGGSSAIVGSSIVFWHNSQFFADTANSVVGGIQTLGGQASLHAAAGAISGGHQTFVFEAALNANGENAVNGGVQTFTANSSLNANAQYSVSGGSQSFTDDTQLFAVVSGAVSGGTQTFSGNSLFQAEASSSLSGGTQVFQQLSGLNADSNAVSGGSQTFHDSSTLTASGIAAVNGGDQVFEDTSSLFVVDTGAISGGTQTFDNNAQIFIYASQGVSGGTQVFQGGAIAHADYADAFAGGVQSFHDSSVLRATTLYAIDGDTIYFRDQSVLSVEAYNGIVNTGNLHFEDNSTLVLNGNQITIDSIGSLSQGTVITNGFNNQNVFPVGLTINGTNDMVIGSNIFDGAPNSALYLIKMGANTLELQGYSSYSGGTIIQAGTILVTQSASALGTGEVVIEAGSTLAVQDGFWLENEFNIKGTISPGIDGVDPIAQLTLGGSKWQGGATYHWDISDAAGQAGSDWDLLVIDGALLFTSTPSNPFVISVNSISGVGPGQISNFDPYSSYSWLIAQNGNGFADLMGNYTIDASNFTNAIAPGSSWNLTTSGAGLYLAYVVPEPNTASLAGAILAIWTTRRRRRR